MIGEPGALAPVRRETLLPGQFPIQAIIEFLFELSDRGGLPMVVMVLPVVVFLFREDLIEVTVETLDLGSGWGGLNRRDRSSASEQDR